MAEGYEPKSSALIVVDVQKDFCPGGALAVEYGDTIIPRINSLMRRFGLIVATKDWHPKGHVSFASSYSGKSPGDSVKSGDITQQLWPDHCIQGSDGAAFHPDLDVKPLQLILHKGTKVDLDSYSAFFENDHATPTGLEPYLKGLGFDTVYVVGLAEDVCVRFTAEDAVKLGFTTYVIADCTRGVNIPEGALSAARKSMQSQGVGYIQSTDLRN